MLANSTDGAPTPPKPYPAFGMQAIGLLAGLLCGLALGGGAIYVLNENNVSPGSTVARFLLAIIGLLQFLWLVPLALYGWRKRNIGLIVGVLLAALPILVLDAVCFGPMFLSDFIH